MAVIWLQLAVVAAVILVASQFLAKSADTIADKTGLGRSFIGVVLLATATSLPELGTGLTSILALGEPDLAAGDAFGSNLFNLLIIGLLDLYWRNGPILNSVSATPILVGSLGAAVMALGAIAIFLHGATTALSGWYISPMSLLMIVVFAGAMYLIYRYDTAAGDDTGEDGGRYEGATLRGASLTYLVSSTVVVGAAVVLANTGDALAKEMGWEASFVGTLFLAFSTSLPELATSFAAVRLNAPELAVSNVLGSNLFNMGFVLFLDDVAYVEGAFWVGISQVHILTAGMAILMTMVVMVAVFARPHGRLGRHWTGEGAALVALYAAASLLVFKLA